MAFKHVVVVIPGIGGSILGKDGRAIWGATPRTLSNAFFRHSLDQLIIGQDTKDDDLGDGIDVYGVMPDVQIIPGLWKIDGYSGLVANLTSKLGLVEKRNLLVFPYDWRRDNRVSARRLKTVAEATLDNWRRESGAADAKLIFVAHSMGGLVARYYVECLDGWKHTRQLLSLGTPYRGSLNALGFLVNGYAKRIGPLTADATDALRSFASVHQLLPTYDCITTGTGSRRVDEMALNGLDRGRVADSVAFHEEIAHAVTANRRSDGYDPRYLKPILSRTQPTIQSARVNGDSLELLASRNGTDQGGDGTVPTISAIAQGLEPSDGLYATGVHASLQNVDAIGSHLIGQLKSIDIDLSGLRAPADDVAIRFTLDDVYSANRPVDLFAKVVGTREQRLLVEATETSTNAVVRGALFPGDGGYHGTLALASGSWRISVKGDVAKPVADIALVVDENVDLTDENP